MVRNALQGIREEYQEKPETVFYSFLNEARARVELPALWIATYVEKGDEKLELDEPTHANRVAEIQEG